MTRPWARRFIGAASLLTLLLIPTKPSVAFESNNSACCYYIGLCCGWEALELWWEHHGDWPE